MKDLTPQEIEQKLQTLPQKLWKLNGVVVKAHQDFLNAEKDYEDACDNAFLTAKAANHDMTSPELKAHSAQLGSEKRLAMILAQAKYEAAKNDSECCDKLLGAFQSIVKLRSSEIRAGM